MVIKYTIIPKTTTEQPQDILLAMGLLQIQSLKTNVFVFSKQKYRVIKRTQTSNLPVYV